MKRRFEQRRPLRAAGMAAVLLGLGVVLWLALRATRPVAVQADPSVPPPVAESTTATALRDEEIPGGLDRNEYLRQRLRDLRSEIYSAPPGPQP